MTFLLFISKLSAVCGEDWWFDAEMTIQKKPHENSHEALDSFGKFHLLFKHIVSHHGMLLEGSQLH